MLRAPANRPAGLSDIFAVSWIKKQSADGKALFLPAFAKMFEIS
jgi:hypothetical protein